MTTLIRRQSIANPDSVGLAPIAPSQDEIDLYGAAELLRWFDVGYGVDDKGIRCRKTKALMGKARTILPTVQKIAAYRNVPSFLFPSGEAELYDLGQQFMPAGEFSLVFVGRPGPNQNAFPIGAATTGTTQTTRLQCSAQDAGSGASTMRVNDGSPAGPSATIVDAHKYANGPAVIIMSHKPQAVADTGNAASIYRMLLSTGVAVEVQADPTESPLPNVHREFHIGGVSAFGSAAAGALVGGDASMWMIFNSALHLNLPLRDLVLRVIKARYSIPTPA